MHPNQLRSIERKLDHLLLLVQHLSGSRAVEMHLLWNGKETAKMPVQITDTQSVTANVTETDAKGNPSPFDATKLVWASSDPTIVTVTPGADGSAVFAAVGPLGAVQATVTDGALNAQDTITVVGSAATAININFGTPA